jgi:hypothetical protein
MIDLIFVKQLLVTDIIFTTGICKETYGSAHYVVLTVTEYKGNGFEWTFFAWSDIGFGRAFCRFASKATLGVSRTINLSLGRTKTRFRILTALPEMSSISNWLTYSDGTVCSGIARHSVTVAISFT